MQLDSFLRNWNQYCNFLYRERKQGETYLFWDNGLLYLLVCNITFLLPITIATATFSFLKLWFDTSSKNRTADQKPFICPPFIKPWFIYCLLKQIFRTKQSTGGINNISINAYALSQKKSWFWNEISVHQKWREPLIIEVYKY